MTFIVVATVACVLIAGLVLAYTAFPHRGEPTPGAPWLGSVMRRAADAVPTIEDGDLDEDDVDRDLFGHREDAPGRRPAH